MNTVTIRKQKCKVPACPDPQLTAKDGYCAMHRQRFLRTGRPGPARPYFDQAPEGHHPARQRLVERRFRVLFRGGVRAIFLRPGSQGTMTANPVGRRQTRKVPTSTVQAFKRRGWIRFSQGIDGKIRIDATSKGETVLEV